MIEWIKLILIIFLVIVIIDRILRKGMNRMDEDFEEEEQLLTKHGFDPEDSAYWHANRVAQLKLLDEINERTKKIQEKLSEAR